MKFFFHSLAFKNFMKFIFSGSLYTGILSSFAVGIGMTVQKNYQDVIPAIMVVFFVGAFYGLILCSIGFIVNRLLLTQEKMRQKQDVCFTLTAFLLAVASLIFFYSGKKLELTWWFLVFPGIPFVGCIYLFSEYSKKWISPLVFKK